MQMLYKKNILFVLYTVVVVYISYNAGSMHVENLYQLNTEHRSKTDVNKNEFLLSIDTNLVVNSDKLLKYLENVKHIDDFKNNKDAYLYFKERIEKLGKDRIRLETHPQYSYLHDWGILGETSEEDSVDQWEEVKKNLKKIEALGIDLSWNVELINQYEDRMIFKCDDYYLYLLHNTKNTWVIDPLQNFSSDNVDYSAVDTKGALFTPWLVRLVTNEKYFTYKDLEQFSTDDHLYDKRLSEFYENMKKVFQLDSYAVTIYFGNDLQDIGIRRDLDKLEYLEKTGMLYVMHIDCIINDFIVLNELGIMSKSLKHCQEIYITFETKHQLNNFINSGIEVPVTFVNSRKSDNADIWNILLTSPNIKNNLRSLVVRRLSSDDIVYLKKFPNLSDVYIMFHIHEDILQKLINEVPNIRFIESDEESISKEANLLLEKNRFIKLPSQSFIQTEEGNANQIRYYRSK